MHDHADFQVIHCNVTAENILLDDQFEAVIGDFRMALFIHRPSSNSRLEHDTISAQEELVSRLSSDHTSPTATLHGTIECIAPGYMNTGVCSEKSDVFWYGIMLLELISGQKPFDISRDGTMIHDWAKGLMHDGNLGMLVDPHLQGKYIEAEVWCLIRLALQCTNVDPRKRPRMSEAVIVLEIGCTTHVNPGTFHEKNSVAKFLEGNSKVHLGKLKNFSFQELEVATENFSKENVKGKGRFGNVYKGQLVDGSLVAVRRLERYTGGGELQFQCEVLAMHKIPRHQNMLPLLGFCMEKNERLLVYPFLVNRSLALALRRHPEFYPSITFHMRKQIAVGVAKVLAFMHEDSDPKIIHHDVKSANIFLDDKFQPLLGHYGWAKFIDQEDIHVSSVGGTIGYIAPEYPWAGQATPKRDVFAFGVTLLEILTGQRAFDLERAGLDDEGIMLHKFVRKLIKEGMMESIVDPNLGGEYDKDEVKQYLQVALQCTNDSPEERPKMSAVVKLLGTAERASLESEATEFPQY